MNLKFRDKDGRTGTLRIAQTSGSNADVHSQDKTGQTALMCAAYEGNIGAVQALLAQGYDVNAKDSDGDWFDVCRKSGPYRGCTIFDILWG